MDFFTFNTFIVASCEPETIFSFEGIIANDLISSVWPVKLAISLNVVEFQILIVLSFESKLRE